MKHAPLPIQPARTRWSTLVAVCRECDGGSTFAKALRRTIKRSGASTRVVRSSCLDVCPKHGVTVATVRNGAVVTVIVDDTLENAAESLRL